MMYELPTDEPWPRFGDTKPMNNPQLTPEIKQAMTEHLAGVCGIRQAESEYQWNDIETGQRVYDGRKFDPFEVDEMALRVLDSLAKKYYRCWICISRNLYRIDIAKPNEKAQVGFANEDRRNAICIAACAATGFDRGVTT